MSIISIKASDINAWTEREPRRAQELLPKLIWKLILATSKEIKEHHFPFENAVQYAGFDGYLSTSDVSVFYPTETSVWEFGTDENIKAKFEDDYKKRTEDSKGIEKSDTAFCFVTSRIWHHQKSIAEIVAEKEQEKIWKSVHVLDANSLELWLCESPSVAAWFSRIIGKPCNDVISLDDYWNHIVNNTTPNLSAEFFSYARKNLISSEILQCIENGSRQIIISAESKLEAILTLAAELITDVDDKKQQILSKMVVALSSDGLNNICANFKNAIIIPLFETNNFPITTENTVIFSTEINGPIDLLYKNSPKSIIKTRRRKDFVKALETMGYEINDADRIAGDVKCRFLPFFRKITNDVNYKLPRWSYETDIQVLIPALLANAWEESLEGDKVALAMLSGQTYEEYIGSIEKYTRGDNMPIFRLEHSFACVSINEMWDILVSRIDGANFDNYKKCISYVFSEVNPAYDLPEDKWIAASIYGKKSQFSERLKRGLIISLTKIVEFSQSENLFNFNANCADECNKIVLDIYSGLTTKNQWRTLIPYISDFVEATPDAVIQVLENNTQRNSDEFMCLFVASKVPLFGRNFYTHILWCLEKLVWLVEYNVRAVNLLVLLEEKNFEYTISNCPLDSLIKIFCLWYPQGSLTIEERKTILCNIIENHWALGAKLINKLLPGGVSTITNIAEFSWKYVEHNNIDMPVDSYNDFLDCISEKFIQFMTPSFEDWKIVLDHFPIFYDTFLRLHINLLDAASKLSDDDKLKLCSELATDIGHERKYHTKATDRDVYLTNEKEKLYLALLPHTQLKYAHYFSYDFLGLNPVMCNDESYDYSAEEQKLNSIRVSALEETLERFKLDSILDLAQNVKEQKFLIDALITSKFFENIDINFIVEAHLILPAFSERLINSIYSFKGLVFFNGKLENIAEKDVKWIIGQLPMRPDVVEFIEALPDNLKDSYWENADTWGIVHCDSSFVHLCIEKLLKYNRPYSAIRELFVIDNLDVELILNVLQAAIELHPAAENKGINLNNVNNYSVEHLFEHVYKNKPSDILRVAQLELVYTNKLGMEFEPQCLIECSLTMPSVFIELISYCFKKDGEETGEFDKDPYLASITRTAIDKINRLPGQTGTDIDKEKFNSWIVEVLNLAREAKYVTACEIQIGKILSYSPVDEDGIWPHKCVRDFFEVNTSKTIIIDFCTGLFNQRGVCAVTGGDEEQEISNKYKEYADKLRLLYPKTAAIIKDISDDYERLSKSERARELKGYF